MLLIFSAKYYINEKKSSNYIFLNLFNSKFCLSSIYKVAVRSKHLYDLGSTIYARNEHCLNLERRVGITNHHLRVKESINLSVTPTVRRSRCYRDTGCFVPDTKWTVAGWRDLWIAIIIPFSKVWEFNKVCSLKTVFSLLTTRFILTKPAGQ